MNREKIDKALGDMRKVLNADRKVVICVIAPISHDDLRHLFSAWRAMRKGALLPVIDLAIMEVLDWRWNHRFWIEAASGQIHAVGMEALAA